MRVKKHFNLNILISKKHKSFKYFNQSKLNAVRYAITYVSMFAFCLLSVPSIDQRPEKTPLLQCVKFDVNCQLDIHRTCSTYQSVFIKKNYEYFQ